MTLNTHTLCCDFTCVNTIVHKKNKPSTLFPAFVILVAMICTGITSGGTVNNVKNNNVDKILKEHYERLCGPLPTSPSLPQIDCDNKIVVVLLTVDIFLTLIALFTILLAVGNGRSTHGRNSGKRRGRRVGRRRSREQQRTSRRRRHEVSCPAIAAEPVGRPRQESDSADGIDWETDSGPVYANYETIREQQQQQITIEGERR